MRVRNLVAGVVALTACKAAPLSSAPDMAMSDAGVFVPPNPVPRHDLAIPLRDFVYVVDDSGIDSFELTAQFVPIATTSTSGTISSLATTVYPDRLFAANTTSSAIETYTIDSSGALTHTTDTPSGGAGPTWLSTWTNTVVGYLFAANSGGGNVSVLELQMTSSMQTTTTTTCASPGEVVSYSDYEHPTQYAWVPCIGTDSIAQYEVQGYGSLVPNNPPTVASPAGSGPRQLAVSGNSVYVVEGNTSTLAAYTRDATGRLTFVDRVSTRAPNASGANIAAQVLAAGPGLCVLNSGDDDIAFFGTAVDGTLTLKSRLSLAGAGPRRLAYSFPWLLVANHDANEIVAFATDGNTWQRYTSVTAPGPTFIATAVVSSR